MNRLNCMLIFFFLFVCLSAEAQFDSEKYDKERFLVGALDEYPDRQPAFTAVINEFSAYKTEEGDLKSLLFIDSLFNSDYPDIYIVNDSASRGIKLYSSKLSSEIDKYYEHKYLKELKKEMFETEKQMASFLLGAFLRNGICETRAGEVRSDKLAVLKNAPDTHYVHLIDKVLDLIEETDSGKTDKECIKYCFWLPNGPNKAKLCAELLKEFDCEEIESVSYEDVTPHPYFVIFKPSRKMREIIDDAGDLEEFISKMSTQKL